MNLVSCSLEREAAVLTLPRFSVITNAKWEENISRKYNLEPPSIVSRMDVTLCLSAFDLFAQEMINKNARQSDLCVVGRVSTVRFSRQSLHTKQEGDTCIHDLQSSVPNKHTQMVCVEGYLWERLGYASIVAME